MKSEGNCRLAWQRGNMAIYAEVAVKVDHKEGSGCSLLDVDRVPEPWRDGIRFGYSLLCESLAGVVDLSGLTITVASFQGQPCDTTVTAAAYVTFHAIADAIGAESERAFSFHDSDGHFEIVSSEGIV